MALKDSPGISLPLWFFTFSRAGNSEDTEHARLFANGFCFWSNTNDTPEDIERCKTMAKEEEAVIYVVSVEFASVLKELEHRVSEEARLTRNLFLYTKAWKENQAKWCEIKQRIKIVAQDVEVCVCQTAYSRGPMGSLLEGWVSIWVKGLCP